MAGCSQLAEEPVGDKKRKEREKEKEGEREREREEPDGVTHVLLLLMGFLPH